MRAATRRQAAHGQSLEISIHAACEGGDQGAHPAQPFRGISIHAACEGGDEDFDHKPELCNIISIHAACEGGDRAAEQGGPVDILISIHAACEGGDLSVIRYGHTRRYFNPRRL